MNPVIAIGLDAADPALLERWMDAGELPALAGLRARGAYGRLVSPGMYRTETSWSTLLSGIPATESGEWGHVRFDPGRYRIVESPSYDFAATPPFYARLPGRRVAVFDVPLVAPVPGIEGIQLCGWGTETNQCLRRSEPDGLIQDVLARHGSHPLFDQAVSIAGDEVVSYRIPSAYDVPALRDLGRRLEAGAQTRGDILLELLDAGPWDLFLGVFSETHTASHLLWHLSQRHPLAERLAPADADPLLSVFQAVDRQLERVLRAVPDRATVVVFSAYGLAGNALDLPSMVFLPEWLERWHGGEPLLGAASKSGDGAGVDFTRYWPEEIASLATEAGRRRLRLPGAGTRRDDPLAWLPGYWYRDGWPDSRAFALPTYADGLVRLNVAGRERDGRIAAADYEQVREELAEALAGLRCARCGRSMVRELVRTRRAPHDAPRLAPPADLVVLWEEHVTDAVDSPASGPIGPLPYFRSGGHVARGMALVAGPGIAPGSAAAPASTTDLTAMLHALAVGGGHFQGS